MFRRLIPKFKNKNLALFAIPKQRLFSIPTTPKHNYSFNIMGLLSASALLLGSYDYAFSKEDELASVIKRGESFGTVEEERETISYLKKQLEYFKEKDGEKGISVSIILMLLARHCIGVREYQHEAIKYGERSCEILFETGNIIPFIEQMDDLVDMVYKISPEEAARLDEKTLKYTLQPFGDNLTQPTMAYLYVGAVWNRPENREKNPQRADKQFDRAKILLEKLEKSNEDAIDVEYMACEAFHEGKRYEDSNIYCKKTVEYFMDSKAKNGGKQLSQEDLKREYFANSNLSVNAFSEGDLVGNDEVILRKVEEGLRYAKRADESLENWPEKSKEYYEEKANTYYRIGMGFFKKQDYDQAIKNWKQAEEDIAVHLDPQNRYKTILGLKMMITEAYARKGDDQKMSEAANETLQFVAQEVNLRKEKETKNM